MTIMVVVIGIDHQCCCCCCCSCRDWPLLLLLLTTVVWTDLLIQIPEGMVNCHRSPLFSVSSIFRLQIKSDQYIAPKTNPNASNAAAPTTAPSFILIANRSDFRPWDCFIVSSAIEKISVCLRFTNHELSTSNCFLDSRTVSYDLLFNSSSPPPPPHLLLSPQPPNVWNCLFPCSFRRHLLPIHRRPSKVETKA